MSSGMINMILYGVWETILMTFASGIIGFILGLPLGVLLFTTRSGHIMENKMVYLIISSLVNVFRAIPFIILIVWMIPFTKLIARTYIGTFPAIVPLSVGVAPFVARMVEAGFLELPYGLIEAAKSMGASNYQIIKRVLIPESLPSMINGFTITLISLVGFSAMCGAVGAGGLGKIGYQYGYVDYNAAVMNTVLILLIIIVVMIQLLGNYVSKKLDHK